MRRWATAGYIDPDPDGEAFVKGRTPISWVGHWVYQDYTKAFPKDVTIVPLPDFGQGTATGMGSWQWGITANATDGDAAWQFISFLLSPREVGRMTKANGAIPATRTAIRASPRFAAGGPAHLYIRQLESGVARPRPQTPAYPALSAAFARAFDEIVIRRRPVKPALDAAARRVERHLAAYQYYEASEP
jgi:multiple sugar transport system substrate-binding protein